MQLDGIGTRTKWRNAWNENWQQTDLESVEVFVAYCSQNGVEELIAAHRNQKPKMRFVVGIKNGVTDLAARNALYHWAKEDSERISINTCSTGDNQGIFHPKVYVFHCTDAVHVLIGSVNLTQGAFTRNTEAAIEWTMDREEWLQDELRHILEEWWKNSLPLEKPNLQERIIDKMKCGLLVNIEAHLATARHKLPKELFELQSDISIRVGSLSYENNSSLWLSLTGDQIYNKLKYHRDKAHENCSRFAFRTDAGLFVPETAIEDWKEKHLKIVGEFNAELERFTVEETKNEIRQNLKRDFRKRVTQLWKRLKKQDISDTTLKSLCEGKTYQEVEAAYDKYAGSFPQTIILSTEATPYVLPHLPFLPINPSLQRMVKEFNFSATENDEQIGWGAELSWMITLIKGTREPIVFMLDKWLHNDKSKSAESWRNELGETMRHLNFYDDKFCTEVKNEVEFVNHPNRREVFQNLREQAQADLDAIEEWPFLPPERVRNDFARVASW